MSFKPTEDTRVSLLSESVIDTGKQEYKESAAQGITADIFIAPGNNNVANSIGAAAEAYTLLHIAMIHQIADSTLLELRKLEAETLKLWSSSEVTPAFCRQQHVDLSEKILQLLPTEYPNADKASQLSWLRKVKSLESLKEYFTKLIEDFQAAYQNSLAENTLKDLHRRAALQGVPFVYNPNEGTKVLLEKIHSQFRTLGICPEIIDFLTDFANQKALFLEANKFQHAFQRFNHEANVLVPMNNYQTPLTNIVIEGPHSVKLIFTHTFYDNFGTFLPTALHARNNVTTTITYSGEKSSIRHGNISVSVNSHSSIYDEKARAIYVNGKVEIAIDKIRAGHPLFPDDLLNIKLFLKDYLTPNNKIDTNKLKDISADALFLLLWNQHSFAETILTAKNFTPHSFFGRDYDEINKDLNLIKDKHNLSQAVTLEIDSYLAATELLTSKIALSSKDRPAALNLQQKKKDLAVEEQALIEITRYYQSARKNAPSNPAFDYATEESKKGPVKQRIERIQSEIAGLQSNPKLVFPLQEIERQLTQPGVNNHYLFAGMLAIKDVSFIRALIAKPAIKNNLDSKVLTHFALQDQQTASALLKPSLWERFKFKVRSIFGATLPGESLPKDRFDSPQLKQILKKYPTKWSTEFARNTEARSKLKAPEIAQLISPKQTRDKSYIASVHNVLNDLTLVAEVNRGDNAQPISASDTLHYHLENSGVTLDLLHEARVIRKAGDMKESAKMTWADIHERTTDEQLFDFYRAKFSQAFIKSTKKFDTYLINAIEDLWGDFPTKKVDGKDVETPKTFDWAVSFKDFHPNKKEIVKAALLDALGDKKINVAQSKFVRNGWLPEWVSIAEVFITAPFTAESKPYRVDAFSAKQRQVLQAALLDNYAVFRELTLGGNLSNESIERMADKLINKDQYSLLKHEGFQALIQKSTLLNNHFRKIFEEPVMKAAMNSDGELKTLKKTLFPKSSTAPSLKDNLSANSKILTIFNDQKFVDILKEFQFIDDRVVGPHLYNELVTMHTRARFLAAIVKEKDLFLFKQTWQKFKLESSKNNLLELSLLLPKDRFCAWLTTNPEETKGLIGLLIQNDSFREKFLLEHDVNTIELLAEQATKEQFETLMRQSGKIAYVFFDKVTAALSPKKHDSVEINFHVNRFIRMIEGADIQQLGLLVLQYPRFLELAEDRILSGLAKKFGKNAGFDERLKEVLQSIRLNISEQNIAKFKNVNELAAAELVKIDKESEGYWKGFETVRTELLAATDKSDVTKAILNLLERYPLNVELVKAHLLHPILIQQALYAAENDGNALQHLEKIFALIVKRRYEFNDDNEGEVIVSKICNAILIRNIVNPHDGDHKILPTNGSLIPYLNKYADEEYIARFLTLNAGKLDNMNDWSEGLSRIANKSSLFIKCFPQLSVGKKFGIWLLHHASQEPDALFYSIRKNETETALISSEHIRSYLEQGDFEVDDVIKILQTQYIAVRPFEPSIRNVLLASQTARTKFKSELFRKEDHVIQMLIEEVNLGDPNLADDIINDTSFLEHNLQGADNGLILKLLDKLVDGDKTDENELVLKSLIALANSNDESCVKLTQSIPLMERMLDYAFESNSTSAKKLLVNTLYQDRIDSQVRMLSVNSEKFEKYLKPFFDSRDGSGLVKVYLRLLQQTRIDPRNKQMITRYLLKPLTEDSSLEIMLNADVDPSLQLELLIELFGMLKDASTEEAANFAGRIKAQFENMVLARDPATKSEFIHSLTPNQLVDLYKADGVNFVPAELAYLFRSEIESDELIINSLLLHADENKLLELFAAGPEVTAIFLSKARNVMHPDEPLRSPVDNRISKELRDRILNSALPVGENLLSSLIYYTQPENEKIEVLYQFLRSEPTFLNAYIKELEHSALMSFRDVAYLKSHVVSLIQYGTSQDMLRVIKAFETADHNFVTQHLYALLDITSVDVETRKKLIEDLQRDPALQDALFKSLKAHFTTKDILSLLKNKELEELFLSYFEKQPRELESLLLGDLRKTSKDSPEHAECEEVIYQYFGASLQMIRIHKILNEQLPDSDVTRILDKKLYKAPLKAILFAQRANSLDLARVYNFESQGQGREYTPISEVIFDRRFGNMFRKMIFAVEYISEELVYTQNVKAAIQSLSLEDGEQRPAPHNAKAYMKNFDAKAALKYSSDKGKVPDLAHKVVNMTVAHKLAYMTSHHMEFLYLISEPNLERSHKFSLYLAYLAEVGKYTEFNARGEFCFKGTGEMIPADHAVYYYNALAAFLYHPNDHITRTFINDHPSFAELILRTVSIDENGIFNWNAGVSISPDIKKVPSYYSNTVLYALAKAAPDVRMDEKLAKAFVKSVYYHEGRAYFIGTRPERHCQVPENINEPYLKAVQESIHYLLRTNPGFLASPANLHLLFGLFKGPEFTAKLDQYPLLALAFKNSIKLDVNGKVYFVNSKKEAPKDYIAAVRKAIPKAVEEQTAEQYLLEYYVLEDGSVEEPNPQGLFAMLEINGTNVLFKENSQLHLPPAWFGFVSAQIDSDIAKLPADQLLRLLQLDEKGIIRSKITKLPISDGLKEVVFNHLKERVSTLTFENEEVLYLVVALPKFNTYSKLGQYIGDRIYLSSSGYVYKEKEVGGGPNGTLPNQSSTLKYVPQSFTSRVIAAQFPEVSLSRKSIALEKTPRPTKPAVSQVFERDVADEKIENGGIDGNYGVKPRSVINPGSSVHAFHPPRPRGPNANGGGGLVSQPGSQILVSPVN